MHIDKYKIFSMDYTWKNGKQSKNTLHCDLSKNPQASNISMASSAP